MQSRVGALRDDGLNRYFKGIFMRNRNAARAWSAA